MTCNDVLYVVYYYTVNVGCCVKGSVVHGNCQQCLVAEWLGLSVTVSEYSSMKTIYLELKFTWKIYCSVALRLCFNKPALIIYLD